ncbi:hypothetical protein HYH03_009140 [Edaphochlamys debaryana]|uniref:SRR1-like domain-containing protein n=1 Tax=Edaphochlamys debaryana TaxID=47281 RepID=A0A836BXF2_9CHLO|nr:hypothetical protein HYH03_009140 [Edaphochlamys debaryana]|eukprot:KAG2492475.1 hypothetical protein HYH03_009140 [Edaphochlamys debaryana]
MEDDGWTVVRGKGKGRTGGSLKRARDECCPGDGGPCTAAAPSTSDAVSAGPGPAPPGWGAAGGGGRGAKQRGRRAFRERSAEEQCTDLISAIMAAREEVVSSPFFARLLRVLAEASGHLGHLRECSAAEGGGGSQELVPGGQADGMDSAGPAGTGGGAAEGTLGAEGSPRAASLAPWRCMRCMVVYGLGSAHESRVSRYQLALVLLLRERCLLGLAGPVQLYDPAFDAVDRLALAQLGMQVLEVNEGGARTVSSPTFFYLPHCEGALCDALLGANWGPQGPASAGPGAVGGALAQAAGAEPGPAPTAGGCGLPLLAVLGNSFRTYQQRWELQSGAAPTDGKRPTRPGRIIQAVDQGAVVELATPDLRFPAPSAFNDMALHCFPPSAALARMLEGAGMGGADGAAPMDG